METNTHPPEVRAEQAWRAAADLPPPKGLGKVYALDPAAKPVHLPLYGCSVPAGFPSPADDHLRAVLSLDEHCIRRPAATFMAEVKGNSMIEANIFDGDVLVIDRSIPPVHDRIVVAVLDGSHTVKRLWMKHNRIFLVPCNPAYKPVEVTATQDFYIWGVVAWILHSALDG